MTRTGDDTLAGRHSAARHIIGLGRAQPVNRVTLTPRQGGYGFPIDFTIQYSLDGVKFANVPNQQYTGFANPRSHPVPFAFLSPVQAR